MVSYFDILSKLSSSRYARKDLEIKFIYFNRITTIYSSGLATNGLSNTISNSSPLTKTSASLSQTLLLLLVCSKLESESRVGRVVMGKLDTLYKMNKQKIKN